MILNFAQAWRFMHTHTHTRTQRHTAETLNDMPFKRNSLFYYSQSQMFIVNTL